MTSALSRRDICWGAVAAVGVAQGLPGAAQAAAIAAKPVTPLSSLAAAEWVRGARPGAAAVLRACGVVRASGASSPARPFTETAVMSWSDHNGTLCEHRQSRVQVDMGGRFMERVSRMDRLLRPDAEGAAAAVLARSRGVAHLLYAAPHLTAGAAWRIIDDPGAAMRDENAPDFQLYRRRMAGTVEAHVPDIEVFWTARTKCPAEFAALGISEVIWSGEGRLARWQDAPARAAFEGV